jgi:predicted GIY-YIG superfamily endonuclease
VIDAINREKAIKSRPRRWKVELIRKASADWRAFLLPWGEGAREAGG